MIIPFQENTQRHFVASAVVGWSTASAVQMNQKFDPGFSR